MSGAPPDGFDPNGQNWGFPTYNWEEMAKDDYGWWRKRLQQMAESRVPWPFLPTDPRVFLGTSMPTELTISLGSFASGKYQVPNTHVTMQLGRDFGIETSVTAALGRFRPSHPIERRELEEKGIWDFDRYIVIAIPHCSTLLAWMSGSVNPMPPAVNCRISFPIWHREWRRPSFGKMSTAASI